MSIHHAPKSDAWLADFHAGRRDVLEAAYREHFRTVFDAVGRVLDGPDRESVTQDVFLRMLSDESFRRAYQGGSLAAWLATVARNRAIDLQRRRTREVALDETQVDRAGADLEEAAAARQLITRFQDEVLPAKWRPVFEARFVRQLDQKEAAAALHMNRTTLAYQEMRIRRLLKRYILKDAR